MSDSSPRWVSRARTRLSLPLTHSLSLWRLSRSGVLPATRALLSEWARDCMCVWVCVYLGNNIFVATHFWILLQCGTLSAFLTCHLPRSLSLSLSPSVEVNMHFIIYKSGSSSGSGTNLHSTINNLNVVAAAVVALFALAFTFSSPQFAALVSPVAHMFNY